MVVQGAQGSFEVNMVVLEDGQPIAPDNASVAAAAACLACAACRGCYGDSGGPGQL